MLAGWHQSRSGSREDRPVAAAVEEEVVEEASKEASAEVWKGGCEGSKTVRERASYIASKRIAVASSSADHSVTRRQVTRLAIFM